MNIVVKLAVKLFVIYLFALAISLPIMHANAIYTPDQMVAVDQTVQIMSLAK